MQINRIQREYFYFPEIFQILFYLKMQFLINIFLQNILSKKIPNIIFISVKMHLCDGKSIFIVLLLFSLVLL